MDSLEDDWEQSLATTFDIDKLSLKLSDIENASFEFGAGSIIASDTDNAKEVQYQDLFPEALSTPTVFLEDRKSFTLSDRRKWEDMQKSYMTLRQLHEGSSKKLQEAKEIIKKLRQQISVQSKEGLFLKKCLKQASLQKKQLEMQLSAAQKQSKQRSSTPTASFARNDPLTSVSVITAAKTQMAKSHEKLEGTLVENKLLEAALEVKASDFGLTREEIRSGLLCELVSLRETTRKLRSENDMIRSKFRELELRYNRIKVDIKYHQSAAVDANKTTDMAKKSTDEMIGMLEKTKDELARLKAELDEAQKAIRNKDAEFSRIKDEHANTVRALELNASELRIEIEREKQKNEHHSHVMEMTKDEIVKSHKREIERLHSEMEAAQKHYESKYSAQAKKLESKIEKMKQEFQKDVSSYKKLLEEEKKKLNEQADKSKQGLLGELELLHKSIAKERQSWATERDELEKAHNEAMQRMLSDMDKQLQRIHEQQAIIVREREKIPQLEEKIRQLKDREADLLRQLDRLHDEGIFDLISFSLTIVSGCLYVFFSEIYF
eukprot:TRINITY_DN6163_c0_g1_i4.p1 TRINITY_DN6163_c0_g1~~TRINITY_DN6163_c0_g1_i4.p1  ORF type:complete len:550 (+),score=152.64 TRINITY_DN6163_c0_g1_i4:44-1693(+)